MSGCCCCRHCCVKCGCYITRLVSKKYFLYEIIVSACYLLQSEKMVAEGSWVSIVKVARVLRDYSDKE